MSDVNQPIRFYYINFYHWDLVDVIEMNSDTRKIIFRCHSNDFKNADSNGSLWCLGTSLCLVYIYRKTALQLLRYYQVHCHIHLRIRSFFFVTSSHSHTYILTKLISVWVLQRYDGGFSLLAANKDLYAKNDTPKNQWLRKEGKSQGKITKHTSEKQYRTVALVKWLSIV